MQETTTPPPATDDGQQKKNKSDLKGILIIAALLVLCFIGFGMYAVIDGGVFTNDSENQLAESKEKSDNDTNADKDEQENLGKDDDKDIDNKGENKKKSKSKSKDVDTTKSLISPYLGLLDDNLLFDIFDLWSYERTDLYIAYLNAKKENNLTGNSIEYDLLEQEYKYLFGSDKTIEKTDYDDGFHAFYYHNDSKGGFFEVDSVGGGGTSNILFSIEKTTRYEGDKAVVEVYHEHISNCSDTIKTYCTNANLNGYYTKMNSDIKKVIEDNDVTVYKMNFYKDGDHYVLKSITE